MTEANLILFLAASLLVIITPGQDMILVMSRSLTQGSAAGVATAAGISTGLIVHTVLAAFGLGAILQASELLFFTLKVCGGIYLIYLGVKLLRTRSVQIERLAVSNKPLKRLFFQGALSNLSNPKIAVFYFAFLPQFISSEVQHPTFYLLGLGIAFAVLTFVVKVPIGFFAGYLSKWLRDRPAVLTWMHRTSGILLMGLGLRLAFERKD
jgi:threonine/homoserine/homoserine lactone efflux protein